MRVLVCGGRKYTNSERLFGVLDGLSAAMPITAIAHGAAKGADTLAGRWAASRGMPVFEFPADWSDISHPDACIVARPDSSKYDAKAGTRRNEEMLKTFKPYLVIAFSGGNGTAHMVQLARSAGITVRQF
jgi:hypothetical protein